MKRSSREQLNTVLFILGTIITTFIIFTREAQKTREYRPEFNLVPVVSNTEQFSKTPAFEFLEQKGFTNISLRGNVSFGQCDGSYDPNSSYKFSGLASKNAMTFGVVCCEKDSTQCLIK